MGLLTKAAILLAEKGWVEFPNLFKNHGLRLNIDDVVFRLGSLEIRWYGLLISGVVVLCIFLGLRSCKKYGIEPNDLLDYLIFSLPAAVIGLRVYYVAFNFEEYRDNIWDIFHFWRKEQEPTRRPMQPMPGMRQPTLQRDSLQTDSITTTHETK